MYQLIKTEGAARRAEFVTVHGTVQTPAFMNVATAAAIKGGISAFDLKDLKCQVMLCNTYHLHLRPGDNVVRQLGGLHRLARSHFDRQRRVPSVFTFFAASYRRKRCNLRLTYRWPSDFYGTGGKHADSIPPWLNHCHGV